VTARKIVDVKEIAPILGVTLAALVLAQEVEARGQLGVGADGVAAPCRQAHPADVLRDVVAFLVVDRVVEEDLALLR
jgi:hypothetical protein